MCLGEKIRHIYQYIKETKKKDDKDCGEYEDEDLSDLVITELKEFDYSFDDLKLAQMMLHMDKNREFYSLDTAQQIVDA